MVQDDWNQGLVTGFVAGLSTSGPSAGGVAEENGNGFYLIGGGVSFDLCNCVDSGIHAPE